MKKTYTKPELTVFGSVRNMTGGSVGPDTDTGGQQAAVLTTTTSPTITTTAPAPSGAYWR